MTSTGPLISSEKATCPVCGKIVSTYRTRRAVDFDQAFTGPAYLAGHGCDGSHMPVFAEAKDNDTDMDAVAWATYAALDPEASGDLAGRVAELERLLAVEQAKIPSLAQRLAEAEIEGRVHWPVRGAVIITVALVAAAILAGVLT